MRALFFTNFRVKLVSLLAAVLLWFTIHLANPPEATLVDREFPGLPIDVKVAAGDPHGYEVEPGTVTVRLRGDLGVLQGLREEKIEVFVNLTDINRSTKGLRKRIQVHPPEGTRLMSVDPEDVMVERLPAPPPEPK